MQGPCSREADTPPSKPLQISTRGPERVFLPALRYCHLPPASGRFLQPVLKMAPGSTLSSVLSALLTYAQVCIAQSPWSCLGPRGVSGARGIRALSDLQGCHGGHTWGRADTQNMPGAEREQGRCSVLGGRCIPGTCPLPVSGRPGAHEDRQESTRPMHVPWSSQHGAARGETVSCSTYRPRDVGVHCPPSRWPLVTVHICMGCIRVESRRV